MFSRVVVIPFKKVTDRQTLEGCLNLRADLKPVLEKSVLNVGTLIELRSSFVTMREDGLFKEICSLMAESSLDMRSQMNYALLLYSTGKVTLIIIIFTVISFIEQVGSSYERKLFCP